MSEEKARLAGRERKLLIALGALCAVLVALFIATAYAFNDQVARLRLELAAKNDTILQLRSEIASKDGRIAQLTSQVSDLQGQVNSLQDQLERLQGEKSTLESQVKKLSSENSALKSQISTLQAQLTTLQGENTALKAQVQELQDIVSLRKSETWVSYQTVSEPAGSYVYWTFYAEYPGYVVVTIHTSTTANNYAEVMWSAYGINYDQRVSLSPGESAAFPVLPTYVEVRVGNTNWFGGATQTVSIEYYY